MPLMAAVAALYCLISLVGPLHIWRPISERLDIIQPKSGVSLSFEYIPILNFSPDKQSAGALPFFNQIALNFGERHMINNCAPNCSRVKKSFGSKCGDFHPRSQTPIKFNVIYSLFHLFKTRIILDIERWSLPVIPDFQMNLHKILLVDVRCSLNLDRDIGSQLPFSGISRRIRQTFHGVGAAFGFRDGLLNVGILSPYSDSGGQ